MTEQSDDAWVSSVDSPEQASALANAASTISSPAPKIDAPLDGPVKLPGGFRRFGGSGGLDVREVREAWVTELTGEHEEKIARVAGSRDSSLTTLVEVLLECGVTHLGDAETTTDDLRNLLVGDRDYLLLEISRATYGNEIDYEDFECPNCRNKVSFAVRLDNDVPVTRLEKLKDQQFDVPLKRGKIAKVRLPNGDDQRELTPNRSVAEANTVVLDRIILSIRDGEDGEEVFDEPGTALRMSIKDRQTILQEVAKRQPGPRYNEITFTHEDCGREVTVPFGLMSLFPQLI